MSEAHDNGDRGSRPGSTLEVDFALVVAQLVESAKNDPSRLRNSIYELARMKLLAQAADGDGGDQQRMVKALEVAIQGVEKFAQRQETAERALLAAPRPQPPSREMTLATARPMPPANRASIEEDEFDPAVRVVNPARTSATGGVVQVTVNPSRRGFEPARALEIILVAAALVIGFIYLQRHPEPLRIVRAYIEGQTNVVNGSSTQEDSAKQAAVVDPLLPKTFGVYAVSGDKLFELEPLQGRVPDQRVAVSAAITTPSHTSLPDGKARFIVYRRDWASNAPDRADVRVIAKIASDMAFDSSGKPTTTATTDVWVIRNVVFDYRVAPVQQNMDMFQVRNEDDKFSLPPGRYALVIKGTAFDFNVAGQISDPNQCLERVNAANGSFYSPCRKP